MSLLTSPKLSAFSKEPSMHSREGSRSLSLENKPRAICISNLLFGDTKGYNPIQGPESSISDIEAFNNELPPVSRAAVHGFSFSRYSHNSLVIGQLFPVFSASNAETSTERSLSPIQDHDNGNSPLSQYGSPPPIPQNNGYSPANQHGIPRTQTDSHLDNFDDDGNSPFSQYGSPPSMSQNHGISPSNQYGVACTQNNSQDNFDDGIMESYSPEELEPWKFLETKAATPFKSRSTSVLDHHSSFSVKSVTPSKSQAAASSATENSYLPIASEDSSGNKERWYRQSSDLVPGIIIDSHQSKHVHGHLFGINRGARGDKFQKEHCSEEALRSMLDHILNFEECDFLLDNPSQKNPTIINLNTSGNRNIPYDRIVISSIVFCPERNAWCLHFFPDLHPRQ